MELKSKPKRMKILIDRDGCDFTVIRFSENHENDFSYNK